MGKKAMFTEDWEQAIVDLFDRMGVDDTLEPWIELAAETGYSEEYCQRQVEKLSVNSWLEKASDELYRLHRDKLPGAEKPRPSAKAPELKEVTNQSQLIKEAERLVKELSSVLEQLKSSEE